MVEEGGRGTSARAHAVVPSASFRLLRLWSSPNPASSNDCHHGSGFRFCFFGGGISAMLFNFKGCLDHQTTPHPGGVGTTVCATRHTYTITCCTL